MQNGKYTAVIIDDETWTRSVLRNIGHWDRLGIEIIAEASDGDYGLELITGLMPDIIISDVKMPNMDGLTLLRRLREGNYKTKVLFVSGYDDFDFVKAALKLQANDYLLKPVKPDELNEQLARCVRELEEEQRCAKTDELRLQGVIGRAWFPEYVQLRTGIYESLLAGNAQLMTQRLSRLGALITEVEGDSPAKDVAIYVYFDFNNVIHRFISESGYMFAEIFDGKEGSYVFGSDFDFSEMLQTMEGMLMKASVQIQQLRRERNRIDLKAVRQYIDTNFSENISLEKTAERFYVSKEYLSKVFKDETGLSFSAYITDQRMKKARSLLITDGMPIKEIAELVGYKEVAHFYKVFKKYFGRTPGEMLNDIKIIQ